MGEVSVGEALVRGLKAEGVRYVFGLPGGHTLPLYDALYHTPEIRHILVRHEAHAAAMAAGHAQLTGKPGIVCVTAGPGATNLVTSVAEAFIGALPMIIIAGRGPTRNAHRGASQEIDHTAIFAPITKWAVRIDRPDLALECLRQAFVIAKSGKPGPVLIDVPQDIFWSTVEMGDYRPVGAIAKVRGDAGRIMQAATVLMNARRPLIVAGGGAMAADSAPQVRALAERLAIPVATTLAGRGILPDDHPLAAGGLGHHRQAITARLLPEADVVLGLGCRFEQQETNWKPGYVPDSTATYIQVDLDPTEIGRSVVPQIGIIGDAALVVEDLLAALDAAGAPDLTARFVQEARVQALLSDKAALMKTIDAAAGSRDTPIHPLQIIRAVREVFPPSTILGVDVGVIAQAMGGTFPYMPVYDPRSMVVASSFYGMGFATSALPVAKLVHPDRPAVGFVGDGSFSMVDNILPLAAEYGLPVTYCIFNDNALGSIRDTQTDRCDGRYIGTSFSLHPDFAALARACHCHGERVEDPERVRGAIEEAKAANDRGKPAVLDFAVASERTQASGEFFRP